MELLDGKILDGWIYYYTYKYIVMLFFLILSHTLLLGLHCSRAYLLHLLCEVVEILFLYSECFMYGPCIRMNVPRDVSLLKFIFISHLSCKNKYKVFEAAFATALVPNEVVFEASLT